FVSDPDADSMTVTIVFWNGTKEHFRTNITGVANNSNNTIVSYTLTRNNTNAFLSGQNWTCAARATDNNDIYTSWVNASVTIQNTAPSFDTIISNLTFYEEVNQLNVTDLDNHFSDANADNLIYTSEVAGGITVSIDSFNNLSYIPSPNWFGTATINITADDGFATNKSNIITLVVTNVAEKIETFVNVLGKSTKLVGIEIIVPSPISMFINDKVVLPIIIRNNKQNVLTNIKLETKSSSEQLITKLKQINIKLLSPGEQITTELEIMSGAVIAEDKYTILLSATTGEGVSDSAEFFVNVADFGAGNRTVILPRLQVAKDLFKSNPQCLELSELLNQAEEAISEKKFSKSESLIENAIKGCKDLLSFEPQKIETPARKSRQNLILLIELLSLLFLTVAFIFYRKRRKINEIPF
ncbi:hypothetical protein J4449_03205, partial [Candidatus Woesearchaeota archaeon]|nr:hypothetical protein [Candidatus Woesearchaeota archaeon]